MIHLVLTGGRGAGTFDLNSSDACVFGTQPTFKAWQAGYTDPSSTAPILVFTLSIQTSDSPPTFTFGALTESLSGQQYNISTIGGAGIGSGSADVQDMGATAKMSMNGKTKEGYGATATVQCNKINRI